MRNAVRSAGRSLHNLRRVEVLSTTAEIEGDELTNYKAHCKIAFMVDGTGSDGGRQVQETAEAAGPMAARRPG